MAGSRKRFRRFVSSGMVDARSPRSLRSFAASSSTCTRDIGALGDVRQ